MSQMGLSTQVLRKLMTSFSQSPPILFTSLSKHNLDHHLISEDGSNGKCSMLLIWSCCELGGAITVAKHDNLIHCKKKKPASENCVHLPMPLPMACPVVLHAPPTCDWCFQWHDHKDLPFLTKFTVSWIQECNSCQHHSLVVALGAAWVNPCCSWVTAIPQIEQFSGSSITCDACC